MTHVRIGYMPAGGEARARWFAEQYQRGFGTIPGTVDAEAGVPLQHADPTVEVWHYPVPPIITRPSGWFPFWVVLFIVALTAATVAVVAR